MKGLMIKDLINLKKQGMILGILFLFYAVLGIMTKDSSMMGAVMAVLAAMMPVSAMAYDEKAKWDKYALSMPVSRRDMVLSKYLLGILFAIVVFFLNVLFYGAVNGGKSMTEGVLFAGTLSLSALVYLSLVLPALFRFGVEKGRVLMMAILFLGTGGVVFASLHQGSLPPMETLERLQTLLLLAVLVILCVSAGLSLRIYNRKEI